MDQVLESNTLKVFPADFKVYEAAKGVAEELPTRSTEELLAAIDAHLGAQAVPAGPPDVLSRIRAALERIDAVLPPGRKADTQASPAGNLTSDVAGFMSALKDDVEQEQSSVPGGRRISPPSAADVDGVARDVAKFLGMA